jgi:magnesium transporter
MIEYYLRKSKGEIKKLNKSVKGCWVKAVNPSEDEINSLVNDVGLHRDIVLDGLDINEIPRMEVDEDNLYFFLRSPKESGFIQPTSFLVVLTKGILVTISKEDVPLFGKLYLSKDFLTNGEQKCILQIFSLVSKTFNLSVNKILKEVKTDKRNLNSLRRQDLLDLVLQEDLLNDYLSSFSLLIAMYHKIVSTKLKRFGEEEKEFIEDLIIDLDQTHNSCKGALYTINNMRDYYSTSLSSSLDRKLTILTIFTIFLTIPTVLSGLYGMNINLPYQDHPQIFFILLGSVLVIWSLIVFVLKRLKF